MEELHVDHIHEAPRSGGDSDRSTRYPPDSFLAQIFGQDSNNQVVSQYVDISDNTEQFDTYYAYTEHQGDSLVESPLSANASFISSANNDSFYQQSNDSFVQKINDIRTTNTPLDSVSGSWGVPSHPWDSLMTPELEHPPHLQHNVYPIQTRQQQHQQNIPPQFPTPTSAGASLAYSPIMRTPQVSSYAPVPYHSQQLQFHQLQQQHLQQQKQRLPTPEEQQNTHVKVEALDEDVFEEQYIPQQSVERLQNYLSRVSDVHAGDEPMGLKFEVETDKNKTESESSPAKELRRVKRSRSKKPRASRSRIVKAELGVEEEFVPIVERLRKDPTLWERVHCTKKKGIYKCSHCPGIFTSLIDLASHLDEFKVVRPCRCPFADCPWSVLGLPRRAEVRRHCAAQHSHVVRFGAEDGDKPRSTGFEAEMFQCSSPLCLKMFKRKDACQRHEKLVHQNPDSRFNKRVDKLRDRYGTEDVDELTRLLKTTDSHREISS